MLQVWKDLARDKHGTLFYPNVNDEEKKFYNIFSWLAIPTWLTSPTPRPGPSGSPY
jgi:hypothetical protein